MPIPARLTGYINNDMMVEVDNIFGVISNASYNSATVTVTLVDVSNLLGSGAGSTVSGFPLTLSYTGAAGTYRVKIPYTITNTLQPGTYTLKIDVNDSGSGNQAHVEIPVSFTVRNQ